MIPGIILSIVARVRARSAYGRSEKQDRALWQGEVARLAALGIHPQRLAGRLRLVLTIGCYRDFRFTRDILSTSATEEQIELAIRALVDLGARCDCEVFHSVGQMPMAVMWHHPAVSSVR